MKPLRAMALCVADGWLPDAFAAAGLGTPVDTIRFPVARATE